MGATETPTEFSSMRLSKPATVLSSRAVDQIAYKYCLDRNDVQQCLDILNSGQDIVFMRVSQKVIADNDPGFPTTLVIGGLRYFAFVKEPSRSMLV